MVLSTKIHSSTLGSSAECAARAIVARLSPPAVIVNATSSGASIEELNVHLHSSGVTNPTAYFSPSNVFLLK